MWCSLVNTRPWGGRERGFKSRHPDLIAGSNPAIPTLLRPEKPDSLVTEEGLSGAEFAARGIVIVGGFAAYT